MTVSLPLSFSLSPYPRAECGSALIVGMLLLAVLSLLAISGMYTSASELMMSGNEQYRARAFEAAQTGIERAIAAGSFNSTLTTTVSETLEAGDSYKVTIRPRGTTAPPPGYDATADVQHFEIESHGLSLRGSHVTSVQGLFVAPQSGARVRTYWYRKDDR
jgi:type IV pilus assembly protein PilX